ncbi:MAG TPA: hypothetical protein PLU52_00375 [Opitutaceae bacterium]|nr:hypothetical protein [Opitutaceae bacterium]
MKKISDYSGILEDDVDVICRFLDQWKPSAPGLDEKAYERELFGWLKQTLPGVAMKTQYGIAWGTADIVIQDTYLIELKLGFAANGVGEFDRCVGQLWRYKEKWIEAKPEARVWLVLVGESEAEFHHLLERFVDALNEPYLLRKPFRWMEKS